MRERSWRLFSTSYLQRFSTEGKYSRLGIFLQELHGLGASLLIRQRGQILFLKYGRRLGNERVGQHRLDAGRCGTVLEREGKRHPPGRTSLDERLGERSPRNLLERKAEPFDLGGDRTAFGILDRNGHEILLQDRVAVRKTVRQAADPD